MKIGIISDTHDRIENIKKAVKIFRGRNADCVFHLGDYVSPAAVRAFRGVKLTGIFGNNDGEKFLLIRAFNEISGELKDEFCEIEKGSVKFVLYHGKYPQHGPRV